MSEVPSVEEIADILEHDVVPPSGMKLTREDQLLIAQVMHDNLLDFEQICRLDIELDERIEEDHCGE